MNKMFAHQIGRNVQVYVNDMLIKGVREDDHLSDLQETFNMLRTYNMKLNPSKCAFRVTAGKFLGFMVSQRGIEVNPEKVSATLVREEDGCQRPVYFTSCAFRGAEERYPQWRSWPSHW